MSDQIDDNQNFALLAVAAVLGLVVAGVLTLAISTALHSHQSLPPLMKVTTESAPLQGAATAPAMAQASASASASMPEPGEAEGRIYFALGSGALPADAAPVLAKVTQAARAQPGKAVLISGYHDASGDPVKNEELAKARAVAVRQALEASGIAPERLVLDKPLVATGGADAREARRVEMRLQ